MSINNNDEDFVTIAGENVPRWAVKNKRTFDKYMNKRMAKYYVKKKDKSSLLHEFKVIGLGLISIFVMLASVENNNPEFKMIYIFCFPQCYHLIAALSFYNREWLSFAFSIILFIVILVNSFITNQGLYVFFMLLAGFGTLFSMWRYHVIYEEFVFETQEPDETGYEQVENLKRKSENYIKDLVNEHSHEIDELSNVIDDYQRKVESLEKKNEYLKNVLKKFKISFKE